MYDYKLIATRVTQLRRAREVKDTAAVMYRLRSGLLRNLGGITDTKLYQRSLLGTKRLIHDYLDEVVQSLNYIANEPDLAYQTKLEFFTDTRQSFGNTALLLHGGATFGMYHLGVVKCLHSMNLLPRVLSGTSVGALVASLVCTHEDADLPAIFEGSGINIRAFSRIGY